MVSAFKQLRVGHRMLVKRQKQNSAKSFFIYPKVYMCLVNEKYY